MGMAVVERPAAAPPVVDLFTVDRSPRPAHNRRRSAHRPVRRERDQIQPGLGTIPVMNGGA